MQNTPSLVLGEAIVGYAIDLVYNLYYICWQMGAEGVSFKLSFDVMILCKHSLTHVSIILVIFHLVHTQNFPKNYYFLTLDTA